MRQGFLEICLAIQFFCERQVAAVTAQVAQILSLIDLRFVHNDTAADLVVLRPVRSRMKLQSGEISTWPWHTSCARFACRWLDSVVRFFLEGGSLGINMCPESGVQGQFFILSLFSLYNQISIS